MLRNRSGAVMSDQTNPSFLSPTNNSCSPVSPFFNSPRIFNGFLTKNVLDAESMSPTSILDSRNSNLSNPFVCERRALSKPRTSEREAIGLALIDSIVEEKSDCRFSKLVNRAALFGSKLKVQIPEVNDSPAESTQLPADLGIKKRRPAKELGRQLSLKEMETSEDYTCVITHGPNRKTTHIYDDRVVESSCLDDDESETETETEIEIEIEIEPSNFLKLCYSCKAILGEDKDIYMYRGEKAFCSQECRCQEMIFAGMDD